MFSRFLCTPFHQPGLSGQFRKPTLLFAVFTYPGYYTLFLPVLSRFILCCHNIAAKNIGNNHIPDGNGAFGNGLVDKGHTLGHLLLGDGPVGLHGHQAAVNAADSGGDGALGIGAFIFGIFCAPGAGIALYFDDLLAVKRNGQLAAKGAYDAGEFSFQRFARVFSS